MGRRHKGPDVSGLLLVDKPLGISSFDVVAKIRRAYQTRRVGHTGTLDPMATGLLPIVLGRATRLAMYATNARKSYSATIVLGQCTNTYDLEGEVIDRADPNQLALVTEAMVVDAVGTFEGQISQVPPAFSAIKVDGERAYARARRGEDVAIPPRDVFIHDIRLTGMEGHTLSIDVDCSKGTYIRSIAHDLGQSLRVGGTLSGLRRTAVGPWTIQHATPLQSLVDGDEQARQAALLPIREVVRDYPSLYLNDDDVRRVRNGQRFAVTAEAKMYCACDNAHRMVALVEVDVDGVLKVVRGIPPASNGG